MIRVMIEHKVKDPEGTELAIEAIRELRDEALKQPGYVTGETLVNTEDPCIVLVISNWRNVEDWHAWDVSEVRQKFTQERIIPLLAEPYTVRSFQQYLSKEKRVWTTF
jgi:heme-degrading monooxygenase HmoA